MIVGFALFLFLVYFGVWLLKSILGAMRSGHASAAGRLYRRDTQALMFWLTLAVQLFFALSSFYTAYLMFLRSMP